MIGQTRVVIGKENPNANQAFDLFKSLPDTVAFTTQLTIVDDATREQQQSDLAIEDFKALNRPIIETDHCFLGIGGTYGLPATFVGRNGFGHTEGLNARHMICIPSQSASVLFEEFGVNGKKDRPENEEPGEMSRMVLQYQRAQSKFYLDKIYKLFNPGASGSVYNDTQTQVVVSKQNAPFNLIREYGYAPETAQFFPIEDANWILEKFLMKRFCMPKVGSTLHKKWLVDFGVEQHQQSLPASSQGCSMETAAGIPDPHSEQSDDESVASSASAGIEVSELTVAPVVPVVPVRQNVRTCNNYPTNETKDASLTRILEITQQLVHGLQSMHLRDVSDPRKTMTCRQLDELESELGKIRDRVSRFQ
jgi:hypothetical protein